MSDLIFSPRPEWHDRAACRGLDTDLFFPEQMEGGGTATARHARETCMGCPVRLDCLEAGLWERYGFWGGLSYAERRKLRKEMGLPDRQALPVPCGTNAGYSAHRRRGETSCRLCTEARTAHVRERRESAA